MLSMLWFLVFHLISYHLRICLTDLYQVNQARTLCYSDEAGLFALNMTHKSPGELPVAAVKCLIKYHSTHYLIQ